MTLYDKLIKARLEICRNQLEAKFREVDWMDSIRYAVGRYFQPLPNYTKGCNNVPSGKFMINGR